MCGEALTKGVGAWRTAPGGSDREFSYRVKTSKYFEKRAVGQCTVRILSGWVVATRNSPRNLTHAHPSRSEQGSSSCTWSVGTSRAEEVFIKP
jgi:hypothetical protein